MYLPEGCTRPERARLDAFWAAARAQVPAHATPRKKVTFTLPCVFAPPRPCVDLPAKARTQCRASTHSPLRLCASAPLR